MKHCMSVHLTYQHKAAGTLLQIKQCWGTWKDHRNGQHIYSCLCGQSKGQRATQAELHPS